MRVHVVRDKAITPGGCAWLDIDPEEMVFTVAADGVTEEGAVCLEACWAYFLDSGRWLWQAGYGAPITTTYWRDYPPGGGIVEASMTGSHVQVWLSPEHFTATSAAGLTAAVEDCVATGWTAHLPAVERAARGAA